MEKLWIKGPPVRLTDKNTRKLANSMSASVRKYNDFASIALKAGPEALSTVSPQNRIRAASILLRLADNISGKEKEDCLRCIAHRILGFSELDDNAGISINE